MEAKPSPVEMVLLFFARVHMTACNFWHPKTSQPHLNLVSATYRLRHFAPC